MQRDSSTLADHRSGVRLERAAARPRLEQSVVSGCKADDRAPPSHRQAGRTAVPAATALLRYSRRISRLLPGLSGPGISAYPDEPGIEGRERGEVTNSGHATPPPTLCSRNAI